MTSIAPQLPAPTSLTPTRAALEPAPIPVPVPAPEVTFVGVSDWSGREVWMEQGGVQRRLPYRGDELLDGFAWGHYGYAARELARSVLHEVTDSPVLAEVRCRDFAREVVAQLPADAFALTRTDVLAWLEHGRVPPAAHAAG